MRAIGTPTARRHTGYPVCLRLTRRGRAFLVAWTLVLGYVAGLSLPQDIPGHTVIVFDSPGVDVAMVDVIR